MRTLHSLVFLCMMLLTARLVTADPSTTQPSQISAAAGALLDQVDDAFSSCVTLRCAGVVSLETESTAQDKQESKFESSMYRPGAFRHTIADEIVIVGAGEKAWLYLPARDVYQVTDWKAGAPFSDLSSLVQQSLLYQNPALVLALSTSARTAIVMHTSAIDRGSDVLINKKTCPTLRVTQRDGQVIDLTFDPTTHLLRRVVFDLLPMFHARGATDAKSANLVVNYSICEPDETITPDQFAFTPPDGSREMPTGRAQPMMAGGADEQYPVMQKEGHPLPDFALEDLEGAQVTAASLRGKVSILDFWATWCGPCQISLGHLNKVFAEYAPQGLLVYAVNQQEEKPVVAAHVRDKGLKMPVLLDQEGALSGSLDISALPTMLLIGPDGVIRKVWVGFDPEKGEAELRAAIQTLLEEKTP